MVAGLIRQKTVAPLGLLRILLSLVVVSFGQPIAPAAFSIIAASIGFALFWTALDKEMGAWRRFFLSLGWYTAVQLIQLSWMTSTQYVGSYLLVLWILISLAIGLQFALLTFLLFKDWGDGKLMVLKIPALASLWIFMEWSRLHFLCGFSWNPVGLSLATSIFSKQMLALGGIFGLSFWVICTNIIAFYTWRTRRKTLFLSWLLMACLPYFWGFLHLQWHQMQTARQGKGEHKVLLVQTALRPEQKFAIHQGDEDHFIPPWNQWIRIFSFVKEFQGKKVDLVVLPEGCVPYGTKRPVVAFDDVRSLFQREFGAKGLQALPALSDPWSSLIQYNESDPFWAVSNGYLAQALSNLFNAEVVIGLEDFTHIDDPAKFTSTQSAFHFRPQNLQPCGRYDKQVLVPMAEYVPFDWCRTVAAKWGILHFYTPGKHPHLFQGRVPFCVNICYEETFGGIMRKACQEGSHLLINISNDVWYPKSTLPQQHWTLGSLRSVENGVPVLRACNTGVTGAIDSLGRTLDVFGRGLKDSEWAAGALYIDVPAYFYPTLYKLCGDTLILTIGGVFIASYCLALLFFISKRYKILAKNEFKI